MEYQLSSTSMAPLVEISLDNNERFKLSLERWSIITLLLNLKEK